VIVVNPFYGLTTDILDKLKKDLILLLDKQSGLELKRNNLLILVGYSKRSNQYDFSAKANALFTIIFN
jgi:hypothetical protein